MVQVMVFRPGALGDTLLAFPALAALRRAFPAARLVVIGNVPALALARDGGLADEVASFDALCWADLFAEEGIHSPEARQMLAGTSLAVLWMRDGDGQATRNLRALGIPQVLCAPGRPPAGVRIHAADYLLGTLASIIGETAPDTLPPLALAPEALAWAEEEWARRGLMGASVLALHPGSGQRAKCWPPDRFAALAGRFIAAGWQTLILEGPADEEAASAVLRLLAADRAQRVAVLTLPKLAALLARAKLYVGNDSGVSHLSALLGVPTLTLFGPTDPAIWAPRGARAQMVWAGTPALAGVTLPPMTALSVNVVLDAAGLLLHPGW
ncbi:MAG TPA: glycosyltransferase family 9 protein [Ktedonobacterales bacterium]|nr:glycosyltransferase family 9 protein [Ktedonobacterales bacterium]